MIHVAIVDDEELERIRLKKCIEYLAERKKLAFSVREFSNGDHSLVADPSYLH